MFEILMELLGYVRKLLPLMELYIARRPAQPTRDPAIEELQNHVLEILRENRADMMELRSTVESVHQRLKVVDEQFAAIQREISRNAERQRIIMIAVIAAALGSIGALIAAIIAISRH